MWVFSFFREKPSPAHAGGHARVCGEGMWGERGYVGRTRVCGTFLSTKHSKPENIWKHLKTLNIQNCFVALSHKSLPASQLTWVCPSREHQPAHSVRSPLVRLFSPKLDCALFLLSVLWFWEWLVRASQTGSPYSTFSSKWEFEQMGILATFSLDRQNGNVAWCRLLDSCCVSGNM